MRKKNAIGDSLPWKKTFQLARSIDLIEDPEALNHAEFLIKIEIAPASRVPYPAAQEFVRAMPADERKPMLSTDTQKRPLNDPAMGKARSWLREKSFINGAWTDHHALGSIRVINPATNELIGTIPDMGPENCLHAIRAAHRAQPSWAALTAAARGAIVRRMFELMMQHQEALAALLTLEQGKPLAEARDEIAYAASFFEWFAEEGKRTYGEVIPSHEEGMRFITIPQPLGVVGAITPWNYPSAMVARKLAAALSAGCTIVLKPSEVTPFSALAIAAIGEKAGVPPGVINIITGDAETIGRALTADPRVRKISFAGSPAVGRSLMRKSSDTVKRVSLELGGNTPFIVFDDANIGTAIDTAIAAKFRNAGQACVAPDRFIVQKGIYDAFVEGMAERIKRLQIGDGTQLGIDIGPLIDSAAVETVDAYIQDAIAKGAVCVLGGKRPGGSGNFFPPTILRDVPLAASCTNEETFGPLVAVQKFSEEDEAVTLANRGDKGVAAYLFTQDLGRSWRVAEALEQRMVGLNTGSLSTPHAPLGGPKQSGLGYEGSRQGLNAYLETKYLCLGL